eukprot:TRINITY_DN12169_c2_g1_i1.p1 TRINITY_DN12169_c2_g1~~TRINITY_DN12169_c2_g1_i1.p1  ORF type:complete len:208 (+),score=-26.51 TRINITY_DN12169_c2_g1_i1:114-737(+)
MASQVKSLQYTQYKMYYNLVENWSFAFFCTILQEIVKKCQKMLAIQISHLTSRISPQVNISQSILLVPRLQLLFINDVRIREDNQQLTWLPDAVAMNFGNDLKCQKIRYQMCFDLNRIIYFSKNTKVYHKITKLLQKIILLQGNFQKNHVQLRKCLQNMKEICLLHICIQSLYESIYQYHLYPLIQKDFTPQSYKHTIILLSLFNTV